EELSIIAGQRAQVRRAKKSVAQFKIRDGMPIGARVTLRGDRMWEFIDRLISIALPRIRDFRGLNPTSFDGRGNYSLGLREQIIFPEIDYDSINQIRGLDVAITTTAETDEQAEPLLRGPSIPLATEGERSALASKPPSAQAARRQKRTAGAYGRRRERVLTGLKRVPKPGRRIYASKDRLPRVLGGLGTAILSTSRGVITSRTAQAEGIGGEVICFVR